MFCEKCGSELAENAVFCSKCGKKVGGTENSEVVGVPSAYQQPINNNFQQYGGQYQPVQQYPQNIQYPPPVQPTVVNNFTQIQQQKQNGWCTASFVVCIVGIFFGAVICGPIAAILGVVGLLTFNDMEHNNRWMGITGIALGIVDLILGIMLASFLTSLLATIFSGV